MFDAEHRKNLRLVLENTDLVSLLTNHAFIAADSFLPERDWLVYRYLNQQFVDEYAVNEADIVMTSKTLLNAFLEEEDYAAMKIFLENLHRDD
jgi:enolase